MPLLTPGTYSACKAHFLNYRMQVHFWGQVLWPGCRQWSRFHSRLWRKAHCLNCRNSPASWGWFVWLASSDWSQCQPTQSNKAHCPNYSARLRATHQSGAPPCSIWLRSPAHQYHSKRSLILSTPTVPSHCIGALSGGTWLLAQLDPIQTVNFPWRQGLKDTTYWQTEPSWGSFENSRTPLYPSRGYPSMSEP